MNVDGCKFNTTFQVGGIFVVLRKAGELYIVQYYGAHYIRHNHLAVSSFELRSRPELRQ